jgi:hypothetical protein
MRQRTNRSGAALLAPAVTAGVLLAIVTGCGDSGPAQVVQASDIPVAHTPPGGYGEVMPAPILARCTEPLAPDAPDLRGTWEATSVEIDGTPAPSDHPLWRHVERIEQCGDRVIVTSTGVIHDMRADGTVENGVNDVSAGSYQPIQVVATFESFVLVLRPVGIAGIEVTRERDGEALVWHYGPAIVVRMRRADG